MACCCIPRNLFGCSLLSLSGQLYTHHQNVFIMLYILQLAAAMMTLLVQAPVSQASWRYLNERYLNINEQIISSVFQVLHAMLKFLKHSGNELKEDFICLCIRHIQNMPRLTFHQLHAGELVNHIKDSRLDFCNDSAHSGILTGSLLQLLCSLLKQSYLKGTDGQDV
jgi:hypothetical protein